MKKDSICQVDVINQQNVTTATNYLEKEKSKNHFVFYQSLPIINR